MRVVFVCSETVRQERGALLLKSKKFFDDGINPFAAIDAWPSVVQIACFSMLIGWGFLAVGTATQYLWSADIRRLALELSEVEDTRALGALIELRHSGVVKAKSERMLVLNALVRLLGQINSANSARLTRQQQEYLASYLMYVFDEEPTKRFEFTVFFVAAIEALEA